MSEFILDNLSNKVFALMPTLPDCKYFTARIDYLKSNRERVVVGVDGNYVELNDNAARE